MGRFTFGFGGKIPVTFDMKSELIFLCVIQQCSTQPKSSVDCCKSLVMVNLIVKTGQDQLELVISTTKRYY